MMEKFEDADPEQVRAMMGPGAVDAQLRQAVQFCWMLLPPAQRSLEAVEKEVRRLVDRMFKDMREDEAARDHKA
jgi:hypothetical protein